MAADPTRRWRRSKQRSRLSLHLKGAQPSVFRLAASNARPLGRCPALSDRAEGLGLACLRAQLPACPGRSGIQNGGIADLRGIAAMISNCRFILRVVWPTLLLRVRDK
jgi:hypothetical protein